MGTFIIIRHGDNDALGKILPGRMSGIHLNANGKRQASGIVKRLDTVSIKSIYSSPIERAIETAEPLSDERDLNIITLEGLIELDYGEWEGKSFEELKQYDMWQQVLDSPADITFPGGESFKEAQSRVVHTMEYLMGVHDNDEETVVCFTHCDIIRLIISYYLNIPLNSFQRLQIDPASFSVVRNRHRERNILHVNLVQDIKVYK